MLSSSISSSTDCLLNLFPMFGHPGISALEYAGQIDKMKEEQRKSETSLKHKPDTSTLEKTTTTSTTTGAEEDAIEFLPPLHFIDEFGSQQRRRGTFINHTPRDFEMRSSQIMEVYRPSRAESENYSRPLSRQSSMPSGSPAMPSQYGHSPSTNSSSFGKRSTLHHETVAELDSTEIGMYPSPEVYLPSTRSHRRSLSAPHTKILTYQPATAASASHPSKESSLRSTSLSGHQSQEKKRQRRQTPFKLITSAQISVPRHAPLEPWVAEHQRKETSDTIETIGDVPVDMDRELSADFGTFGVIQRYLDSQGDGLASPPSVTTSEGDSIKLSSGTSHRPGKPNLPKSFLEPIAIYPIDELELPDDPPPVPDRSPKRLSNPCFPVSPRSVRVRDSDFNIAAQGEYSPYDPDDDFLYVANKRTEERPRVEHATWIGSPNVGRLAPPILGHDAITASSDLRLNDLSFYLKNTGPSPEPQPVTKQRQKKKGMKLFKAKQRNSLAARVGSVEGFPQRARTRPAVPSCAKEMTTSGGARHLKIIIPTESSTGSQTTTINQRRSRHISISFTEEMMNPLASPAVEHMISTFKTKERAASAPLPKSPKSPKRSPKAPTPVPVDHHPLASSASSSSSSSSSPSRDELTRARKLRDLHRIKRKPLPTSPQHTPSKSKQQIENTTSTALPTPAHTPEPVVAHSSSGDEDIHDTGPELQVARLQDQIAELQMQVARLAEALAVAVGMEVEGGEVRGEDVLEAWRRVRAERTGVAD